MTDIDAVLSRQYVAEMESMIPLQWHAAAAFRTELSRNELILANGLFCHPTSTPRPLRIMQEYWFEYHKYDKRKYGDEQIKRQFT